MANAFPLVVLPKVSTVKPVIVKVLLSPVVQLVVNLKTLIVPYLWTPTRVYAVSSEIRRRRKPANFSRQIFRLYLCKSGVQLRICVDSKALEKLRPV